MKKIFFLLALILAFLAPLALFAMAPAHALEATNCYTRTLAKSWNIDNPTKPGVQAWGKLRVYEGWCSDPIDREIRGVWSEAYRNDGGSIKVGISTKHSGAYPIYSLSKWGTGTDWNQSPVLEKDSPGEYWGWADYSGGHLRLYS